ncbi:MAG: TIGR04282 family arsenosugar biosynthesis glycosyltransferase [Acetobacteraceae bacterium]
MTAIAIFVKSPGLSPVKTRLARSLGPDSATDFHRQAAACVAAAARAAMPRLVPYWAVAEKQGLSDELWQEFPGLWQGEGELGCRMARIYAELLARHGRVLLIGADVPQANAALLLRAAKMIDASKGPYVLGPAGDGGFWLLGGARPVPPALWRSVPYSRNDTCAHMARALRLCGTVAWLPMLTDADEISDLPFVLAALRATDPCLPEQAILAHWLSTVVRVKVPETQHPATNVTP